MREISHFGSNFPHFCENVPHFWLYFEITEIAENRNKFRCMETFFSKKLCEHDENASPPRLAANASLSNMLEKIQERALRFVYNDYVSSHADLLKTAGAE